MTATIDVVDHTGLVCDHDAVRELVAAVLAAEGVRAEVSVAFVDESVMTDLNQRYRGAEGPTDVLAFDDGDEGSGDPAPGDRVPSDAVSGGEVVVCPRVVARYAAEEGRGVPQQLGWTIIHGVLHLAGYDHEVDRGEMRARERALLEALDDLVRALPVCGDVG